LLTNTWKNFTDKWCWRRPRQTLDSGHKRGNIQRLFRDITNDQKESIHGRGRQISHLSRTKRENRVEWKPYR